MFRKSLILMLVCSLVFTMALTGCKQEASIETKEPASNETGKEQVQENTTPNPAKTRETKDALIVAETTKFSGNFLPIYAASTSEVNTSALTYSSLLTRDPNGNTIKDLASDYKVSEDGKTITVKLREGVVFSDGTPMTTKDIAFSFNTLADPSYDGPLGMYVQDIQGYDEYFGDEGGTVESMSGIEIIDDYTIKFNFNEALRPNLDNIGSVPIMPEHYFKFEKGHIEKLEAKAGEILGSGPYKFSKYETGQYLELVINENYYGEKKPQIKKVIQKAVEDTTMIDELTSGKIDMIPEVGSAESLELIRDAGFIDEHKYVASGYSYIEFNCMEEPTNDKRVRQALVYGLDRESFVKSWYNELGMIQDSPMDAITWGYTDEMVKKCRNYDYNPAKANELLDEAGWKMGDDGYRYKDGKKLEIELSASSGTKAFDFLTPLMIENYKDIGIELKLDLIDFNSLYDKVFYEREGWMMYSMSVSYGSPDPDYIYSDFHSAYDVEGGYNASKFHNELNDRLLDEARKEFDIEKANKLYEEWSVNITEEMPRMVLNANIVIDAANNRVKGVNSTAFYRWVHNICNMSLED